MNPHENATQKPSCGSCIGYVCNGKVGSCACPVISAEHADEVNSAFQKGYRTGFSDGIDAGDSVDMSANPSERVHFADCGPEDYADCLCDDDEPVILLTGEEVCGITGLLLAAGAALTLGAIGAVKIFRHFRR